MPGDRDVPAFLARCGDPIGADELRISKARATAAFLTGRNDVGASLLEVRRSDGAEWLVVSVEVDVGQAPFVDIRREEPVAIGFDAEDRDWPAAVSLRPDFPERLSHVFLDRAGRPVRLCLSEEPWADVKRRWSPMGLVRQVRTWFIDTARGALHRPDQPLEPFLLGSTSVLILPADPFSGDDHARSFVAEQLGDGVAGRRVYRVREGAAGQGAAFVVTSFRAPPRRHGVINRAPPDLLALTHLLQADDFDFNALLEAATLRWLDEGRDGAFPIFLVAVPMTREAGGPVERTDVWAFLAGQTVGEVAAAYQLANATPDGKVGKVLPWDRGTGPYGGSVPVEMLNPTYQLTAQDAAVYSGLGEPSGRGTLVVGAGALGSQVVVNLIRMGERITGIVDTDVLLPHNMARHAMLDHHCVGWPKASVTAEAASRLLPSSETMDAFVVDAASARPDGAAQPYADALAAADLILDMAASVPVSRRLALDEEVGGRRVATFLSPSGRDLVVLAEDDARSVPLDHLEMNYYAAVAADEGLAGHFDLPGGVRYARSCREMSAQLSQAHIAVHAGIAADRVRRLAETPSTFAGVWRLDPVDLTVARVDVDVRPLIEFKAGGWTVLVSPSLIDAVADARGRKLPVETGGVLLGDFDVERRRVYLVFGIESPADSRETETSYIRGAFGLQEAVDEIERRTLGMLRYVGEWHSHPDGCPATPSEHDLALYLHLAREMEVEGYPPIMLISGDRHFGLLVDGEFGDLGKADGS